MAKSHMGHEINAEGRECSLCHEFKTWLKPDGRPNFWRHPSRASGFDNQCVVCRSVQKKAHKRKKPQDKAITTCIRCGESKDSDFSLFCHTCKRRGKTWARGAVYLVISGGQDFKPGAHFCGKDFEVSLKAGYFPDGMVVELWTKRAYSATLRVAETELEQIDADPVGDGLYLVPFHGRKPPPIANPFRESNTDGVQG